MATATVGLELVRAATVLQVTKLVTIPCALPVVVGLAISVSTSAVVAIVLVVKVVVSMVKVAEDVSVKSPDVFTAPLLGGPFELNTTLSHLRLSEQRIANR